MSITTTVTVVCDKCGHWDDSDHHSTILAARAGAARVGWVHRMAGDSFVDLCPVCAAATDLLGRTALQAWIEEAPTP